MEVLRVAFFNKGLGLGVSGLTIAKFCMPDFQGIRKAGCLKCLSRFSQGKKIIGDSFWNVFWRIKGVVWGFMKLVASKLDRHQPL